MRPHLVSRLFHKAFRLILAFVSLPIFAVQAAFAEPAETFEAASIKPSPEGGVFRSTLDTSQFISQHHTLSLLLQEAYPEVAGWRISGGPDWVSSEFWDLSAKLPADMPKDSEHLNRATELMLQ